MPRSRSRLLGAFALVGIACAWPREARADWDFQLATGVSGGWVRSLPSLSARRVSTSARDIAAGDIDTRGGIGMFGAHLDVDLTVDDRWSLPLLGGTFWWAAGSQDATVTSFDGSIARLRPWTTWRTDILFPGIGRRWKLRRTMWGAAIRPGYSVLAMEGGVAAGADMQRLDLSASTFLVQLELELCRRLDPTTRACLQVAPRVYEHELMNGVSFGLRMEWGR